ncbi:hypothetical protein ACQPZX_43075 [Actinoplanes sp. CA-142083]|uniref:hypothetical protein n=1 Tax=Actinoplanes sp. CA-142083 TaxID=3239903 RepID=UPI003D92B842
MVVLLLNVTVAPPEVEKRTPLWPYLLILAGLAVISAPLAWNSLRHSDPAFSALVILTSVATAVPVILAAIKRA